MPPQSSVCEPFASSFSRKHTSCKLKSLEEGSAHEVFATQPRFKPRGLRKSSNKNFGGGALRTSRNKGKPRAGSSLASLLLPASTHP